MSGGWILFLFLFILGISAQAVNTFGIWSPQYPDAGYTMSSDVVVSTGQAATQDPITIFVIYAWVMRFVTIFLSGIFAVISLGGLFYGMGWPIGILGAALLQLIQLPANMVIFAWVYELVTGRSIV